jgi:hypothetical protein
MSPLSDDYRTQMESIRDTLNQIVPDCVRTYAFEDLAGAVAQLHMLSGQV